ncbi:MAG: CDP-alcohol phosphatidyltransferase family protein [Gammaproteobacteria bacterium]
MANLITLSRLILLLLVIWIAYLPLSWWHFLNVPLLILVFATDGFDGYVARKRNETSLFGAMFDITSDRIVELSMWVVLADLDLVPVWVPLLFVVRGTIVDTVRANAASSQGESPFAMIRSPIGRFLVAGKFMRIFYAVTKATTFCWLLFLQPMPEVLPGIWAEWSWLLVAIGVVLVWLSVIQCVLRGLPVIVEFVSEQRETILGQLGSRRLGNR